MRAKLKIFLGIVLMAPFVVTVLLESAYQIEHPARTPMQVFNEFACYLLIFLVPFAAGIGLFHAGAEENSDPE